jgi:hypothetical protein
MKYLLSGAAIAAPLAIAGPPAMNGTDTQLGAAPSVSYPSSATPSRHRDARAQRLVPSSNTALHHHAPRPSRRIADRLNHQELLGCRRVAPNLRGVDANAGSTAVQRAMDSAGVI